MAERVVTIRKFTSWEEHNLHHDDDELDLTPAQRIGTMWQLTLQGYALAGAPLPQPGLSRHVVRVVRRAG